MGRTITCYFGLNPMPSLNTNILWWTVEAWDATNVTVVTCLKKNASATYAGASSKTPSDGQMITLDDDEYLTGISFNGATIANSNSDSRLGCFCICDSNGLNHHKLIPWDTMVPGEGSIPASTANKSGQSWTDLTGKTIALGYMQGDAYSIYWSGHRQVSLTTEYLARTITILTSGPGTVSINSNSLKRGQTTTLTITPATGYKFDHATASVGTVARTSINTLSYTMPTPASNCTITVYFTPFASRAEFGKIIYADWYNQ